MNSVVTRQLSRILYVEDEPDIREIVRLSLETVGKFTVAVCDSGTAAVEAAPSFRPDLVLLDIRPHAPARGHQAYMGSAL
jgi:CheY-like chemotaxis protein